MWLSLPMRGCRAIGFFAAISVLLLAAGAALPQADAYRLFEEGNAAFSAGDLPKAVESYEHIVKLGYENGAVYYNLGNAYYKLNEVGKCILAYKRAQRFIPGDADLEFNLEIANLSVVDQIVEPPQFILFKIVDQVKGLFSLSMLGWSLAVSFAVIMVVVSLVTVRLSLALGRVVRLVGWPVGVVWALALLLFIVKVHDAVTVKEAVVMVAKTDIHSAPSEDSVELFSLHEGAVVNIEKTSGSWVEIRLADGKVGWMPAPALEII